jgi:hypothetical protein
MVVVRQGLRMWILRTHSSVPRIWLRPQGHERSGLGVLSIFHTSIRMVGVGFVRVEAVSAFRKAVGLSNGL